MNSTSTVNRSLLSNNPKGATVLVVNSPIHIITAIVNDHTLLMGHTDNLTTQTKEIFFPKVSKELRFSTLEDQFEWFSRMLITE